MWSYCDGSADGSIGAKSMWRNMRHWWVKGLVGVLCIFVTYSTWSSRNVVLDTPQSVYSAYLSTGVWQVGKLFCTGCALHKPRELSLFVGMLISNGRDLCGWKRRQIHAEFCWECLKRRHHIAQLRVRCWRIWKHVLVKAQWLLYVPPGSTLSSSTFCPHSVFMCFVWIWEQTAIISLCSINGLVFITETECVYCAVRTGFLCILQINHDP